MMTYARSLLRLGVVVICLMIVGVSSVHATPITFQFQGTVKSVVPSLSSKVNLGDLIVGSYTFDSGSPCSYCDIQDSVYSGAITDFSIQIGSYVGTFAGGGPNSIIVSPLSTDNSYVVRTGFSGNIADVRPDYFQLSLEDFTGTALAGNHSLSSTPPNIAGFRPSNRWIYLNFYSPTSNSELGIAGDVTSITNITPTSVTPTNVPEPATLTLLALAVGLLASRGLISQAKSEGRDKHLLGSDVRS